MNYVEFGRTGLRVPPIVFGTSCLGNLYQALPWDTKLAIMREYFRQVPAPVVLDTAGKYGAGMALEVIGRGLRGLAIPAADALISNKLGWYQVPLTGPEPTFEPGAWAGLDHDAVQRISGEGILACWEQGCRLLGVPYKPQLASVHDPDEYLAAATDPDDRRRRWQEVLDAYRALMDLKARGEVRAIGVGSKDWRVIREICDVVDLDWVMFACSLTVHTHPAELLAFMGELQRRRVAIVNSAVFNAGFLIGGPYFDYRQPDPLRDAPLFAWREAFLRLCRAHQLSPATVCVQFGLSLPGVVSVALNTSKPERVAQNVAAVTAAIPDEFWTALKDAGLLERDFPYSGGSCRTPARAWKQGSVCQGSGGNLTLNPEPSDCTNQRFCKRLLG